MAQFNVAVSLAKNEQAKFQMLQDTIETVRQAEYSYKTLKANLRKMFKEYNKGVMKKK